MILWLIITLFTYFIKNKPKLGRCYSSKGDIKDSFQQLVNQDSHKDIKMNTC